MCLFITMTPCTADFNRTQMKRVLKGASVLSAFLEDHGDHCLYYLANDRHCACDLRESGPDPGTGALRLKQGALRAVSKVVDALGAAGIFPLSFAYFGPINPSTSESR